MDLTRRDLLRAGALGAAGLTFGVAFAADEFDTVILHGEVIDPESRTRRKRHLGLRGGRIAAISEKELRGKRTIDARGLVVAPGFIDPISHGQDMENDILQAFDGVTTKLQMEVGVPEQDAWHKQQAGKRLLNYGAGCSHTLARSEVFGDFKASETAVATPDQIRKLAAILDRELKKGALGVGFGLEYQPSSTRWEVVEMFRVAGRYGVSCHCHTRYGTLLEEQNNLTAIQEVLADALIHGAALHVCHVPSMALGQTDKALALIERAQARGLDVSCDFYPYTAFATGIETEVFAEGWQKRFGMDYGDLEWAATHERLTPETFERYRAQGGTVVAHGIPETAVQAAVKSRATMLGSDGSLEKGVGHPRSSGTFSRVLGRYVRELKLISLEDAIAKMTIMPARRFEKRCPDFKRKGRISPGADADLVVFDPAKVADRATFESPGLHSTGFGWVLVGGVPVIAQGELVEGKRPGRGLRAPQTP